MASASAAEAPHAASTLRSRTASAARVPETSETRAREKKDGGSVRQGARDGAATEAREMGGKGGGERWGSGAGGRKMLNAKPQTRGAEESFYQRLCRDRMR